MILKVQRPLASNKTDPLWLVYDQSREVHLMLPPAKLGEGAIAAMGSDVRAYFEATLVDGMVVFGKRVAEQSW